jgi:hypothetical protein
MLSSQADGRVLRVFPNPQGYQPPAEPPQPEARPFAQAQFIDGTMGFPEGASDISSGDHSGGGGGLYSDSLVSRTGRGMSVRGDWSR